MKKIELEDINVKNLIRLMMEDSEYQQFKEISEALNIKRTTFQSALNNDALRFRDFMKVADLLGYTVKLEKK